MDDALRCLQGQLVEVGQAEQLHRNPFKYGQDMYPPPLQNCFRPTYIHL